MLSPCTRWRVACLLVGRLGAYRAPHRNVLKVQYTLCRVHVARNGQAATNTPLLHEQPFRSQESDQPSADCPGPGVNMPAGRAVRAINTRAAYTAHARGTPVDRTAVHPPYDPVELSMGSHMREAPGIARQLRASRSYR